MIKKIKQKILKKETLVTTKEDFEQKIIDILQTKKNQKYMDEILLTIAYKMYLEDIIALTLPTTLFNIVTESLKNIKKIENFYICYNKEISSFDLSIDISKDEFYKQLSNLTNN